VSLLAASAAPTPLYATYGRAWGFTSVTTTIVFGVYAVAVLAALLTLGRLSDYLGRRPGRSRGFTGRSAPPWCAP
jgi:MFS family permease